MSMLIYRYLETLDIQHMDIFICMYDHVCLYVHICYVYVRLCMCICACMYMLMHMCVDVYLHVYMYICPLLHACIGECMYVDFSTDEENGCVYVYVCAFFG